jgi:hypothetical protein
MRTPPRTIMQMGTVDNWKKSTPKLLEFKTLTYINTGILGYSNSSRPARTLIHESVQVQTTS